MQRLNSRLDFECMVSQLDVARVRSTRMVWYTSWLVIRVVDSGRMMYHQNMYIHRKINLAQSIH